VQFEFGTTPYSGALTPATVTGGSGNLETISTSFSEDLQPGTTYYYRACATNQDGTTCGAERSFTTPGYPNPFAAPKTLPLLAIPVFPAVEYPTSTRHPKHTTKAQKLAKALKVCKKKPKSKRASCEKQAHKKYGPSKKKK
jgi:hypothetical protein